MSTRRLLPLLAIAIALPASAQYVATTTNGVPYPALTAGTPIPLVALAGTANDRGRATIPLGFTVPYYDRTYSQLTVTANGMAFFEPSSSVNAGADFSVNGALPNVSEPNGVLAPFWDDLNGRNPGSVIQSQALTGPNGQGLAVEWSDWNHFLTSQYSLTFQLRVWANGIVEFYYGGLTGNGTTMTATVGIENPAGTVGVMPKACGAACALTDFTSNQLIVFGPAPGPDLSINSLKVNGITTAGSNLNVSTTLSIRNFGTQAANNFTYRLYLSSDTVYNPGIDVELTPTPQGPLSIPALASLNSTVTTSVPRPASGSFYLLAIVDDADVVMESNEFNNLGATSVPLAAGVDLVAQSITGPPLGGPGEMITSVLTYSNQGIDTAGAVPVKIWLSNDNLLSANDLLVYSGTRTVNGGENVVQSVTYALPNNIPAGDYYFILQLDDGPAPGIIPETSETNNVKVGAVKFTAKQADLIVDSVVVLEPLPPYGPARYAFFAEPIRLEAVVRNQGGATAPNVSMLFFVSDNDTLNGITDPFVGQVTGLTLAPGESKTVTVTAPVPANAVNGMPQKPGEYYFFAAAVAQGLVEISAQNNFLKSDPQAVRSPAPDLIVSSVRGPQSAGAGEAILVTRTVGNVGNRPAGPAKVRYYLSANSIITEADLLLPIRTAGGTLVNERSVTLGVGAQDLGSDVVVIPPGTPQATWYLGVLVDPPGPTGIGDVPEIDDDNNGLAGQTIAIVAQALGLAAQPIPDGLLGLAYRYQLAGKGGSGSYTFALEAGSTLPDGLQLAADGTISGMPTTVGSKAFSVVVTSGGATATELRAMRVVPISSTVAITSQLLPPAARLLPYFATLGVVGGSGPYLWSVSNGAPPPGISLSSDGVLTGSTAAALAATSTFTVQVTDGVGNRDQRELSITIVDASALLIDAAEVPEGQVGAEYVVDVLARNAGGAPVSKPMTWSVVSGQLPDGIALEPTVDERVLISGTPLKAGVFPFTLQVEDARGRSDTADFVMRITPPALVISGDVPAQVLRGDTVSVQFAVTPALPNDVWSVRDGELPKGLSLDPTGLLSGTVAAEAPFGSSNFTVAIGSQAGATTLRPVSIEVVSELTKPKKGCGCADAPGGAGALVAIVALAWRRRPSPA